MVIRPVTRLFALRPAALLVCAAVMVSTMSGCRRDDSLKIGYLGTLSGRHSDLGVAGRDGTIFAVEEINRAGGINGKRLKLVVRDDEGKAESAQTAVRELIAAGVTAIVGPMTSSMAVVTVPIVNNSRVIMVSPTVSTGELSGRDDNFLRIYPTNAQKIRQLAEYARKSLGLSRLAVVYDLSNRSYTDDWRQAFTRQFESLGGTVAPAVSFDASGQTDYLSVARTLLAKKPQGVLILAGGVDSAMFCQQIRKLDTAMALFATEWSSTPELLVHGGSAVEGIVYCQNFIRDDDSTPYVTFCRSFDARFGQIPDFGAVYAYQAVRVIGKAFASARTVGDLKGAILGIGTFPGLQGEFTIDRFGDADRKPFLMTVRQGAFRRVEVP
ncbi:ABC transporter substrate-binding protein [Geobacter anodireducens]|nr:ABC transporter substrate-binding protein [Geobacter anodireducens]